MKKFRTLVGVIAASSILIGAGYAGWSEQVALETTVETGTFCVQIVSTERADELGGGQKFEDVKFVVEDLGGHGENTKGQAVELKIDNLYPGSQLVYKLNFKNLGTVDATMKNFKATIANQENSKLIGCLEASIKVGDSDWQNLEFGENNTLEESSIWAINKKGEDSVLIKVKMKEEISEDFNHHVKHMADFEMEFNWEQTNLRSIEPLEVADQSN